MAHHSSNPEMNSVLAELSRELGLGATGSFPQGKFHRTDEGELRLAITASQGKVIMAFGTPTAWIGFDPQQARDIAETLLKRAKEAEA